MRAELILAISVVTILAGIGCEQGNEEKSSQSEDVKNHIDRPSTLPSTGDVTNLDRKPLLPPGEREGYVRTPKINPNPPNHAPDDLFIQEFREEFKGLAPHSEEFRKKVSASWKEIGTRSFNRKIANLTEAAKTGRKLPPQAVELLQQGQIEKDKLPFAIDENETKDGRWLTGLATMLSIDGGKFLTELLSERANKLPPSQGDLAIFYACIQGIRELNPSTNRPILEDWEELAAAANPIYRLIAIKASIAATPRRHAHLSTENPKYNEIASQANLKFLQAFLNEEDPTILAETVRAISAHSNDEANAMLEQLANNPTAKQDPSLQQSIKEAITAAK